MLGQVAGKLFFKLNGWTYEVDPEAISDPKQVIIGFPHTSNRDGILAVALFSVLQLHFHLLIKQELFKFPFGSVLKKLGCIPVDRTASKNIVQQMVDEFAKHERFSLVIAPEATRGKDGVKRPIRTGFWYIAKATQVPIVLILSDSSNKIGRLFAKVYPSDSMENDLLEIQRLYAAYGIDVNLPEKSI